MRLSITETQWYQAIQLSSYVIFGYGDFLNNVASSLHIQDKCLDNLPIFEKQMYKSVFIDPQSLALKAFDLWRLVRTEGVPQHPKH